MRVRTPFPVGAGPLLGAVAGALVGVVDGARAALVFGVDGRSVAAVVALSVAVDALAGLRPRRRSSSSSARLAVWGRRADAAAAGARVLAFLIGGRALAWRRPSSSSRPRWRATTASSPRGSSALAAVASAVPGALLAPALARARLARGAADAARRRPPGPALLLLASPSRRSSAASIFLSLWRAPLPRPGVALARFVLRVSAPALVLPWALARVAALRLPCPGGGAGLVGRRRSTWPSPAAAVARSWSDNLRFAPWVDIGVGAAIVRRRRSSLAWRVGPRLPRGRGRVGAAAAGAFVVAVALLLGVSASEAARKAGVARAGLVGPTLEVGPPAPRLRPRRLRGLARRRRLQRSRSRHPPRGRSTIPNDGIDSDCDGQDAAAGAPPAAVMAPVPASVPADLNLVFITIDTLRADHLGCYGYARPTSPEIDRLAGEGTLFENGWAHAPSTRYSMPAIASGRWPSAIEWDESIWWPRLGRGVRTLAEALHDDGYFTGGIFSFNYFAAADRRGFERGMDFYDTSRAALHVAVNGPMESRGTSSRELADDAIAFIDAHKDRKFFLWLHFYDPHLSYEPHPEVPSFGTERMDLYDGEIRFTDLHVGRVLAHLKELGLWGHTAVVLTGDHGEGFGEHGITEHGFDLYAAQTRVPFIVRVPGLPAQRARVPVGHVDIAPTLVNLARGKAEPSLLRALARARARGRAARRREHALGLPGGDVRARARSARS